MASVPAPLPERGSAASDAQRVARTSPPGAWGDHLREVAARTDVTPLGFRVYAVVITLGFERFTAATVIDHLPGMTAKQAGQVLGELARIGLLSKARRDFQQDGKRHTRTVYRLLDGGAA